MGYDRIPDTFPVLSGGGLILRELTEADLPAWFARRTDTEAAALAGDSIATSMQDVVDGLESHRIAFRSQNGLRWAIVPDELGESVGTIGFGAFDQADLSAVIGYTIGRAHWDRGIATRAAGLVVDYGFRVLGLERIGAIVLIVNRASIRVLDKQGFQREEPGRTVRGNHDIYYLDRLKWHQEMLKKLPSAALECDCRASTS